VDAIHHRAPLPCGRMTGIPHFSRPLEIRVEAPGQPLLYTDWQEVYRDNVRGVYRLLYSRVGNRADAEDLTAEVFLATLSPLQLPAKQHEVRAYLVATARTALANFWQRHYASPPEVMLSDPAVEAPMQASGHPPEERLERILGSLPDRCRGVLELRFLKGYSIREAAQEIDVSITYAKVLQYRALRAAARIPLSQGAETSPVPRSPRVVCGAAGGG
jgi:RNA polymerase sigma factor (sigma-70 family)